MVAPSQISYAGSLISNDIVVKLGGSVVGGTTATVPSANTFVISGVFLSTAASGTQISIAMGNMRNPVSVNVPSSSYLVRTATALV